MHGVSQPGFWKPHLPTHRGRDTYSQAAQVLPPPIGSENGDPWSPHPLVGTAGDFSNITEQNKIQLVGKTPHFLLPLPLASKPACPLSRSLPKARAKGTPTWALSTCPLVHGRRGLLGQGVPPWDSYLPLNQQPQLPGTVNKTLPTGQGLAGDQEQECPGSSPGSRATSEGEVGLAALVSGPVFRKCEHLLRSPHLLPPLTPLGRVGYPGRQRAPFGPQAARMSLLRGSGSGGYQNQLLLTRPVWLGYNSWSPQWPQASTPALPQAVLRFYNPQYFFPDDKSRIGSLFKKKKKTGLK